MDQEFNFLSSLFNADDQNINLLVFLQGILLTALLAFLLGYIYIRLGNALSNRKKLAKTLVLISLTTMLIITIVKSSLALSLGLVGALSIVRFRTAIKEPEELAYFFMSIAIGLGIGAGQFVPTLIGSAGIFLVIYLLNRKKSDEVVQNLIIQFDSPKSSADFENVFSILNAQCSQVELRRMDEQEELSEVSFTVSFDNYTNLLKAREQLQKIFPEVRFSFLEVI